MPITLGIETRRVSQEVFGAIAYELMNHVFEIHNEFGRLFHESIYKRELAARMSDVSLEVPVTVSHASFSKIYFLDVLVSGSGLFEFKSAEAIHPRHRAQSLNYLLLADLAHAKIVNVRPEQVEHEFVNCNQRLKEMRQPTIHHGEWNSQVPGSDQFQNQLRTLVADWGSGLELPLYESALCHLLDGQSDVPVIGTAAEIGVQTLQMAAPGVAFKLTALKQKADVYAHHLRRFIEHTPLQAILWANLTTSEIHFETVLRG